MIDLMKKTVAAAAIIVVGVLAAPAVAGASFPVWTLTGPADVDGSLSFTVGTATTSCDVAMTADLVNNGTAHGGSVTSAVFSNCVTTVPNCAVTATAHTSPAWTLGKVTNDATRLNINGVSITFRYAGGGCALDGLVLPVTGAVGGDYDTPTGVLSFDDEPGLTSMFGPVVVSGQLAFLLEEGEAPAGYSV